ncbi:hypothetical protein LSUE1_G001347 [Lachnellula suecica]|uniref:Rhodopsin domain-containing protein n=1 Tax=Lachnellula suecica TaxID=602035 RepID=A0A8T9CJN2_9HELO|nr:hypothetical protein LSUE1_G001347 [Lachnellula suecica]
MGENRGPELAAVLGLFLGLTWLFVSLRLYVKTFINKSWGADDYLIIVALAFFSTYAGCSLSGVKYGTGRHTADILPQNVPTALYYWWLCEIFYTLTTVTVRLSIAILLLRICIKTSHKLIIYGTLVAVFVFSTFYFFLIIFQCHPVSFFWGQYEGMKGSCINPAAVPAASIAHSVVSFTADWVLGLLPIALIWDLKMNRRTKVSVAGLLSLGLLAGVAAMIRVPYIHTLALTDDFLFATTDVAIWSTIEPGLGIVAASGATLRPLFRSFYSLTSRGTQNKSAHGSRAGYLQQPSQVDAPRRHRSVKLAHYSNKSTSELSDDIELNGKSHTVTTSVGSQGAYRESREDLGSKGGIKVDRTVEITSIENEDGVSTLSEEGVPVTPWPRGCEKNGRDMV